MQLHSLNHAAIRIDIDAIKLLCDPWLEGTAFSGGWGLAYENPDALSLAAEATHLWISHWHSDHLHAPTLQKLAARAPKICVLANVSANFSMVERLRSLGFRAVVPLAERAALELPGKVRVVRYPTAGIDNMLHISTPEWSVLNYNDCNLPCAAIERLCRRMGRIDVLLANYNHAGKLFDERAAPETKQQHWSALMRVVEAASPRCVVPFASSHYYRSSWSSAQNASLLTFDELEQRAGEDARFAVLRVGDHLELNGGARQIERKTPACEASRYEQHDYGPSVAWDELCEVANQRCALLSRNFPLLRLLAPTLRVRVHDLNRVLTLRVGGACQQTSANPDIVTHSRALHDWLGRRFGDDTFFAGAHFSLCQRDTRTVRTWALITLLEGSQLDPRSLLRYLANAQGRRFLWNRSEELLATLTGLQLKAGQLRA